MRVPAHIRFTLAEMASMMAVATPVLDRIGSAIHLVLTEGQETLPSTSMRDVCAIISVEDADGITVAVLKHRDGETWDRRHKSAAVFTPASFEIRDIRSEAGFYVKSEDPAAPPHRSSGIRGTPGHVVFVDEHEPLVPRRDPPHAAPAGEDRFQQGVDAMSIYLKRQFDIGGPIQKIEYVYGLHSKGADLVRIDGEFSLRYLAKAFLNAYQPEITISDQVRFKHAKRAMKLKLHHERVYGSIHFLSAFNDAIGEEQVDAWDDILELEGGIDIDALAKAFWSVMKGEG